MDVTANIAQFVAGRCAGRWADGGLTTRPGEVINRQEIFLYRPSFTGFRKLALNHSGNTVIHEKIRIATSSYHVGHAVAPAIALEQGYFRAEGFEDFELLTEGLIPSFVEKDALSAAMKERGVQIVLGAQIPSVLALNSRGEDLYIVFGWRVVPLADWYARPEIKTVADLKAKKVGLRDKGGGGPTRVLWNELRKAGLDPEKDVHWVLARKFAYHRDRGHLEALLSGEVDCTQSSAPFSDELEQMGFTRLLNVRELFPGGRPMAVIAARKKTIEENGRELRAFFRAILRAFWFERDPSRFSYIADLEARLRAKSPSEDERALRLLTSPAILEKRPLPVDGAAPVAGLRQIADEMILAGELPAEFRVERALRDEAVQDAFRDLGARTELEEDRRRMSLLVKKYGF
jgi:ABC-type nitrate/sulfonate/bicarbonate transport system substrate-binding protein